MSAGEHAAINGAAQVLRPPEDGLAVPAPRPRRRARSSPGSRAIEGETIAALRGRRRPPTSGSTRPAARSIPGFVDCHTHLPFAGWRARGVRDEGRRRALRGDRARAAAGSRPRRARSPRRPTTQVLAQAQELRARDARARHDAFECKSGYGLSRGGRAARGRARRARWRERVAQRDRARPRCSRTRCPTATTPAAWMDEVGGRSCRAAAGDVSALDIYVETVAFAKRGPASGWASWRREHGLRPARARRAVRDEPLGPGRAARRARGRSTTWPACTPTTSRRSLPPRSPRCCCPAPSCSAPSRLAAGAGAGRRRARSACWRPTATPAPRRSLSLPLVIGLAVRRYGWSVREALLAMHLERGLGAAGVGRRSARSRPASAPTSSCSTARSSTSPYRFGRNPVAAVIVGGAARVRAAGLRRAGRRDDHRRGDRRAPGRAWTGSASARHGVTRLAWTDEDAAAGAWFAEQAMRAGLSVERDPAGNLWACPDGRAAVVGGGLAPGQRPRRRALRRRARGRVRVRDRRGLTASDRRDLVRRRGGRALQHADVRQQALAGQLDVDRDPVASRRPRRVGRRRACAAPGVDPAASSTRRPGARACAASSRSTSTRARDVAPRRSARRRRQRARGAAAARGRASRARRPRRAPRRRDERRDALAAAARLIVARRANSRGDRADRHGRAAARRAQRADHDPRRTCGCGSTRGRSTAPRSSLAARSSPGSRASEPSALASS